MQISERQFTAIQSNAVRVKTFTGSFSRSYGIAGQCRSTRRMATTGSAEHLKATRIVHSLSELSGSFSIQRHRAAMHGTSLKRTAVKFKVVQSNAGIFLATGECSICFVQRNESHRDVMFRRSEQRGKPAMAYRVVFTILTKGKSAQRRASHRTAVQFRATRLVGND